jgi:hypothetical protein
MGQITATTRLTQTHGGPLALSPFALLDPTATTITLHYCDSHLDSGGNGAILGRLYYNSTATLSGATQQGAQTTAFDCIGTCIDFAFSTAGIPSGSYIVGTMGSNTPGNTNSVDLTLYDDAAPFCQYGGQSDPTKALVYVIGDALLDAVVTTALALTGQLALAPYVLTALAAVQGTIPFAVDCTIVPSAFIPLDLTNPASLSGANLQAWLKDAAWSWFCQCVPAPPGSPAPNPYRPPPVIAPPSAPGLPAPRVLCDSSDLCSYLNHLEQLVAAIGAQVNYLRTDVRLIQRQGVPFGYIQGAAHTGLFDQGDFTVADILGLAVTFTSLPPLYPPRPGDPTTYHQLGKISVGTVDGWERSWMPTHSPYLILPVSGAVTRVGYYFASGIVATITELIREP